MTILPKTANVAPKSLTKTNREKLWTRQHGLCPWCGKPVSQDAMHAHHRLLRSNGGTWALSNIVGLHGDCHNVQPESVHQNPERAYRMGFMIRKCMLTPSQIPVFNAGSGVWMLPDDAGDWVPCLPALAAELLVAAGSIREGMSGVSHGFDGLSSAHSCGENGRIVVAIKKPRNARTSEASATPARFKAQGAAQ